MHPKLIGDRFKFWLPLPRRERFLIEIVKSAAITQRSSRNSKAFFVAPECDRVSGVGLELDCVRTRILRRMEYLDCLIEILIVIGGKFRNDVNRSARSNRPAAN